MAYVLCLLPLTYPPIYTQCASRVTQLRLLDQWLA